MAAEPRKANTSGGLGVGGVAGRFRPLGGAPDPQRGAPDPQRGAACPTGPADAAKPAFATVPWGYKRSEVDAWAGWIVELIAHGRRETIRADSAEATLAATLAQLEELNRDRARDRPERPAARAQTPCDGETTDPLSPIQELPRRIAARARRAIDQTTRAVDEQRRTADHELARLAVVEAGIHEVIALLHHIVGPRTGPDAPATGDQETPPPQAPSGG